MKFTLQSFLLLLKNLLSLFRNQLDRATRRLWYIFGFLPSRFSSRYTKQRGRIHRSAECQPKGPSPIAAICASQLPRQFTSITGDDSAPVVTSPTTISIEVRKATVDDTLQESRGSGDADRLGVGGYLLAGSTPISRSPNIASCHDESDLTDLALPQNRERSTSNSPVTVPPTDSRATSQCSRHPRPRPGSQYSHRLQSEYPDRRPRELSGAEAAARGYLPISPSLVHLSSAQLIHPSAVGSVPSHVYRASRPATPVRRPSPMTNSPRPRTRSVTPISPRRSLSRAPQDDAGLCRPGSRTIESVRHSTAVSFNPPPVPKGSLRPMIRIDRYEKHKKVKVGKQQQRFICPPVTTVFERESVQNWIPLMHPEGALYWVHKEDPVYTDTDMRDPDLRQRIEEAQEEINELRGNSPPLPVGDWELALELGEDYETGEPVCWYYFVCLTTRCLFWLHGFDPESALEDLEGVDKWTHVHLALQAEYWYHWEMYPYDREVSENLVQELLGILVHAGVDCMTSINSTAPYSEGDINKFLNYMKYIPSIGGNYGFSACIFGRLMSFFMRARYLNFYGENGARLANDQTIYDTPQKRTWLIKILSFLFFYTPEVYRRGLESVYTDFVICQHRWARFITQVQDEWKDIILNGTVLLNANVAFLAIPSVDSGDQTRTSAQVASYFSTVTSIGSIVIGLLLVRKHRSKPQDSADEVDGYLRSRRHRALGFEALAILYSLPYSLLMWSTVAFSTAFCLETLVLGGHPWSRISVGIVFAIVALLIIWCVWTTREAGASFSILGVFHLPKLPLVRFPWGSRGSIQDPFADAGSGGATEGRRPQRKRGSTSATLVNENPTAPCGTFDDGEIEMAVVNKGQGSVV